MEDAMSNTPVPVAVAISFESLKQNNEHGARS